MQLLWLSESQQTVENLQRLEYQIILSGFWEICMQVEKQQLELNMERQTDSIRKGVCKGCILSP